MDSDILAFSKKSISNLYSELFKSQLFCILLYKKV